mgnify:FL=1
MKTTYFYSLLTVIAYILWITPSYAIQDMKFRYFKTENGLASNMVNCVFQDSRGYMWFGTGD